MKNVLLLNGPNLDMLGVREPDVYGHDTLADLERTVWSYANARGVRVTCFQSNSEGALVDRIHQAHRTFDGIVYNPGAHTHYSYALRDALGGIDTPCVEVHISDVDAREAFRRVSVTAPACVAQVKGRGFQGYCDAVDLLLCGLEERLGEGFEQRCAAGQVVVPPSALADERVAAIANRSAASGEAAQPQGDVCAQGGAASCSARPEAAEGTDGSGAAEDADAGAGSAPDADPGSVAAASTERLGRLRAACADAGVRTMLVCNTSDIAWLTGFDGVFDEERAHALLVTPHDAVLHTDSRYSTALENAAHRAGDIVTVNAERSTHARFVAGVFAARHVGPQARAAGAPEPADVVLGVEDTLTLAEFRRLKAAFEEQLALPQLRQTTDMVLKLRAVKDGVEVARMRAAQAITDAAFAHIVGFMRPGMTERDVQIELDDYMRRHGASGLAFPTIVACGQNAASPHATPGSARLEAGQCVVMDFGARAHGYCSDMTRTVFLGQPTERMRDAYDAIRAANEQVAAMLAPGVTGKQAHEHAEQVLADAGFGGTMGHALGHGVGIDIHEDPVLAPRNGEPLVAGNVVTVEPGIYLPGEFGMRLEDFGVVTEDGFDVFTRSTHDMVVL